MSSLKGQWRYFYAVVEDVEVVGECYKIAGEIAVFRISFQIVVRVREHYRKDLCTIFIT